jgi:hypothetical protein
MKKLFLLTTLALATATAFAQTADVDQSSRTSSAATSGATAIGGGAASINSNIGGSRSFSGGGAGGAGGNGSGGAATSAVTVNLGSTSGDPSGGTSAQPVANAQQVPNSQPTGTLKERIETVGNAGSSSFGVSFSQYNCASTAGAGVGFMGGAFQFGVGKESDPCNARANAAALFSIAQTLAPTNAPLSAQLYHAAILLIGNSTKDTKEALTAAGVTDWAPGSSTTPAIVPPTPTPEGNAKIVTPPVATLPVSPQAQAAQAIAAVVPIVPAAPAAPVAVSEADAEVGQPIVATGLTIEIPPEPAMADDEDLKPKPKPKSKYKAKLYPPILSKASPIE